jgi:hypothetical protein
MDWQRPLVGKMSQRITSMYLPDEQSSEWEDFVREHPVVQPWA